MFYLFGAFFIVAAGATHGSITYLSSKVTEKNSYWVNHLIGGAAAGVVSGWHGKGSWIIRFRFSVLFLEPTGYHFSYTQSLQKVLLKISSKLAFLFNMLLSFSLMTSDQPAWSLNVRPSDMDLPESSRAADVKHTHGL